MPHKILIINTGSTSLKLALYDGFNAIADISITISDIDRRSPDAFVAVAVSAFLRNNHTTLNELSAIGARGGLLKPLKAGTYRVDETMVSDLSAERYGSHPSNSAIPLAYRLAQQITIPAYTVNPVTVDEMEDIARMTGVPCIKRRSIFHALSHKASARRAAGDIGKPYEECRFIVVHMGGGISIGAHRSGRVVDINNALNGDGPIAPERAGSIPAEQLVTLCFSGAYTQAEIEGMLSGNGGVFAYLGTRGMQQVETMIQDGNTEALNIVEAMAYTIAKQIGALAPVLDGSVDAVILTGGLASWQRLVGLIRSRVQFIAPILVYTGNMEMQALVQGVLDVLEGKETAREYS
jgi:butyrate kinase